MCGGGKNVHCLIHQQQWQAGDLLLFVLMPFLTQVLWEVFGVQVLGWNPQQHVVSNTVDTKTPA